MRTVSSSHSWLDLVTLDAADPRTVAQFWCAFACLRSQLNEDDGRWMVLEDDSGHRVIGLQRSDPRELAARSVSRVMLDVRCADGTLAATIARAVELGANLESHARSGAAMLIDPGGTRFRLRASGTEPLGVTFDVATFGVLDPSASAEFWCAAAGVVQLHGHGNERAVLGTSDGIRLVGFERASAEAIAANMRARVHIDLECLLPHFDAEVDRLIDLGAVRLGAKRVEHFAWGQILVDPDGLVFCQNAYTASELASRLSPATARGR